MGSFQQITLGAICVAGAFWFGHYLNNNPHPDQVVNEISKSGSLTPLESKTSLLEPGMILTNPAGDISETRSNESLPPNRMLPPPSQLDSVASTNGNGRFLGAPNNVTRQNQIKTDPQREIVLPDFSELAANFRDTRLELPPLKGTVSPTRTTAAKQGLTTDLGSLNLQERNGGNTGVPGQNPHVGQASSGNPVRASFDSFPTAPAAQRQTTNIEMANRATKNPIDFSATDFTPQLKDRLNAVPQTVPPTASGQQADRGQPFSILDQSPQSETATQSRGVQPRLQSISPPASDLQPVFHQPLDQMPVRRTVTQTQPRLPNGVVSLNDEHWPTDEATHAMRAISPSRLSDEYSAETRTETSQRQPDGWATRGAGDLGIQSNENQPDGGQPSLAGTSRAAKPMVPFGLSDDERSKLVRLRKPSERQIKIAASRFTDHLTVAGETLPELSTKYYGRPDFYLDIYMSNQSQLRNPAEVPAGVILKIPVYE